MIKQVIMVSIFPGGAHIHANIKCIPSLKVSGGVIMSWRQTAHCISSLHKKKKMFAVMHYLEAFEWVRCVAGILTFNKIGKQ